MAAGTDGRFQHSHLLGHRACKEATRFDAAAGRDRGRKVKPHQHLVQLGFKILRFLQVIEPQLVADRGPAQAAGQRLQSADRGRCESDEDMGDDGLRH